MPKPKPPPSKAACVIVVDVSKSMNIPGPDGRTGIERAKETLHSLIEQKLLFSKKDELGIVLVGTKGTENLMNEEEGGYDNITVYNELQIPDIEMTDGVGLICPPSEMPPDT